MISDLDTVTVAEVDDCVGRHYLGQTCHFSLFIDAFLDEDFVGVSHHGDIRRGCEGGEFVSLGFESS